jgi:hypothetical protein
VSRAAGYRLRAYGLAHLHDRATRRIQERRSGAHRCPGVEAVHALHSYTRRPRKSRIWLAIAAWKLPLSLAWIAIRPVLVCRIAPKAGSRFPLVGVAAAQPGGARAAHASPPARPECGAIIEVQSPSDNCR